MKILEEQGSDQKTSKTKLIVDNESVSEENHEKLAAALAASLLLAACGSGSESVPTLVSPPVAVTPPPSPTPVPTPTPVPAPTPTPAPSPSPGPTPAPSPSPSPSPVVAKPTTDAEAARFLLRAQFAASDADISQVKSIGYRPWLEEQTAMAPGVTAVAWLDSKGYNSAAETTAFYNNVYPADFAMWYQLFNAPDQMRKRIALALSEFFVVSLNGLNLNWRHYQIADYWDLLSAGAFGNFRKLLGDVTLHPAMGTFLNTAGNTKEVPATGKVPDENYGREVMQLFTIGLFELNPDGTEKLVNNKKVESYSLSDVTNIARVFTGYNVDNSKSVQITLASGGKINDSSFARIPMKINTSLHSFLASTFLGVTIAENTDSAVALNKALDTLFNHTNVGPFFSKQMIQRLVTSNPSPAYVGRIASVFNNNGAGVRGDLKAVFLAILADDEALSPVSLASSTFGKLREPMVRLAQWGRSFGLKSQYNSWKISDQSATTQLGQQPLRAPSVFNYFRPGFVPPSSALVATMATAPEFQIVSEVSVASYLNFMQGIIRTGYSVNGANLPEFPNASSVGAVPAFFDITPTYTAELALVNDAAGLVARLNVILAAGQLAQATQTIIANALNATPLTVTSTDAQRLDRVASAVLLVMGSSEYLIQK